MLAIICTVAATTDPSAALVLLICKPVCISSWCSVFHSVQLCCCNRERPRAEPQCHLHLQWIAKLMVWVIADRTDMKDQREHVIEASLLYMRRVKFLALNTKLCCCYWVEWCPQSDPEDQLSHVQPGPHSHLHPALPGLHWVRLLPASFFGCFKGPSVII